jgi:hypothetical protein
LGWRSWWGLGCFGLFGGRADPGEGGAALLGVAAI